MKEHIFTPEEFYHVYNRGVEKRFIFLDDADRWRFLTSLFMFQWENYLLKPGDFIPVIQHSMLNKAVLEDPIYKKLFLSRVTELVCFCFMPNHFHLILKEIRKGGISLLMQRVGNSYTKYFNAKYERNGHLFGSRFQSIHIDKNEYLTHLSGYIHLTNPCELSQWRGKEIQYPWSSLQDFLIVNRWERFLSPGIILDQFSGKEEYRTFLKENNAIDILDDCYLIDC